MVSLYDDLETYTDIALYGLHNNEFHKVKKDIIIEIANQIASLERYEAYQQQINDVLLDEDLYNDPIDTNNKSYFIEHFTRLNAIARNIRYEKGFLNKSNSSL
jgi:hypothetical protein